MSMFHCAKTALAVCVLCSGFSLFVSTSTAAPPRTGRVVPKSQRPQKPNRATTVKKYHVGPYNKLIVPAFSLKIRLLSGDVNLAQQWGFEKVIYEPQRTEFRFGRMRPEAAKARWQLSDKPFTTADLSAANNGLIATGFAGTAPPSGTTNFFVDLGNFLPASPPMKPKRYYFRLVASDGKGGFLEGPSRQITIIHRSYSGNVPFSVRGFPSMPGR